MAFKRRIYITICDDSEGPENLLAWTSLSAADDGRVAVYELVETLDKRVVPEVRRQGTKKWFKTGD